MASLADLKNFRTDGEAPPRPKIELPADHPAILAFDQSLSNTGWVDVRQGEIVGVGTIKTGSPAKAKGHLGSLIQASLLVKPIRSLLEERPGATVVIETPPVGRLQRPESSLLAASVIYNETKMISTKIVGAQRGKSFICGNGNAKKAEAHEALAERAKDIPGFDAISNEHQRDALLLALVVIFGAD